MSEAEAERYYTPCWQKSRPYDELIQLDPRAEGVQSHIRDAAKEALSMCFRCKYHEPCFRENAGEQWVDLLLTEARRRKEEPRDDEQ